MNVFISLPMANKSEQKIKEEMEWVKNYVKGEYEGAEILDSFIEENPPQGTNRYVSVWYLGKSLEILAKAKLAVFVNEWEQARGCKIEHDVAMAYGIPCLQVYIP